MKSPTVESSFKLIEAIQALLLCDELQSDGVSETTQQLIDGVLETAAQVRRECEFPGRSEMIEGTSINQFFGIWDCGWHC